MSNRYIPLSALRERGLYVGIHTWLYTFTYPCQPIEGEGTVIPLINLSPENEKTLRETLQGPSTKNVEQYNETGNAR